MKNTNWESRVYRTAVLFFKFVFRNSKQGNNDKIRYGQFTRWLFRFGVLGHWGCTLKTKKNDDIPNVPIRLAEYKIFNFFDNS